MEIKNENNINFDDGFRSFSINNDESKIIRFNPGDPSIVTRGKQATKEIDEYIKDLRKYVNDDDPETSEKLIQDAEQFIKDKIDFIFNSKISDTVFGNQSPLGSLDGDPLFYRFLQPALKMVQQTVEKESKASKEKIDKYEKELNKYKTKEFIAKK